MISSRSMSLLEVVFSIGLLSVALVGVLSAFQTASLTNREAVLRQQLHNMAERTIESARESPLQGPSGLFTLCGTQGLVVPSDGPESAVVAVIRTENNTASAYEVDMAASGITNTAVRVVRVHVRALAVSNPTQTNPALLTPLTGPGLPDPVDLVTYRIVE